jgi:hypothetical protein
VRNGRESLWERCCSGRGCCPPWNGKSEDLARTPGEAAEKAVEKWPGIALDLSGYAPDALHPLSRLPDISVRQR